MIICICPNQHDWLLRIWSFSSWTQDTIDIIVSRTKFWSGNLFLLIMIPRLSNCKIWGMEVLIKIELPRFRTNTLSSKWKLTWNLLLLIASKTLLEDSYEYMSWSLACFDVSLFKKWGFELRFCVWIWL